MGLFSLQGCIIMYVFTCTNSFQSFYMHNFLLSRLEKEYWGPWLVILMPLQISFLLIIVPTWCLQLLGTELLKGEKLLSMVAIQELFSFPHPSAQSTVFIMVIFKTCTFDHQLFASKFNFCIFWRTQEIIYCGLYVL